MLIVLWDPGGTVGLCGVHISLWDVLVCDEVESQSIIPTRTLETRQHICLEMGQLLEMVLYVFLWRSLMPPKFMKVPILF